MLVTPDGMVIEVKLDAFRNAKSPMLVTVDGIVTEVKNDIEYSTVEGNTTDKGVREGIMVALRNRHLTKDKFETRDGLRLMGFVYPK